MAAYARGCAAAQVDNLRSEYGAPRYKKGDKVRVVRLGSEVEGSYHEAKIGEVFTVTDVFDDEVHTNIWYFYPYEIEPVAAAEPEPLQLEAGKYYRTRDGRKVGPATQRDGCAAMYLECRWVIDGVLYQDDGTFADGGYSANDLIAEWVDEPKSTKEILDDLEAWMAEQDASRDNTPTPTTGFTVPLCAYDDSAGDEPSWYVTELGRAYADGYAAGLRAAA